jgi:hypothetical protein
MRQSRAADTIMVGQGMVSFAVFAADHRSGNRAVALSGGGQAQAHHFGALHRGEEVERPVVAAEFAIGDRLEADLFLLADNGADRLVLERGEFLGREAALFMRAARIEQSCRTQQAADMIGPERLSLRHTLPSPFRLPRCPVSRAAR